MSLNELNCPKVNIVIRYIVEMNTAKVNKREVSHVIITKYK